jgi:TonB family protein
MQLFAALLAATTGCSAPEAPLQAVVTRPPEIPLHDRGVYKDGVVRLRVRATAKGEVTSVQIVCSTMSPRVDRTVLQAVRRWEFEASATGTEGDILVSLRPNS